MSSDNEWGDQGSYWDDSSEALIELDDASADPIHVDLFADGEATHAVGPFAVPRDVQPAHRGWSTPRWGPRRRLSPEPDTANLPEPGSTNRGETTFWPAILIIVGTFFGSVTLYLALLEVRPLSTDPLGKAVPLLIFCTIALLVVLVATCIAARSAYVARPRHRPVTALLLGLIVAPALLFGAGYMGVVESKRSIEDSAVVGIGNAVVVILEALEDEGVDIGPLGRFTSDQ